MKSTIVGVAATIVACVVGIIYTEWRSTDPHVSGEWITVSADFTTLALLIVGSAAAFILVSLVGIRLWRMARRRFRSKQQRFVELATELRRFEGVTLASSNGSNIRLRTEAIILAEKLKALGIDFNPPHASQWTDQTWRRLGEHFEAFTVLASEGRLDLAVEIAKDFVNETTT